MKLGLRILATMAVSFLLMPALRADDAKNPAASAGKDAAVSSSVAPAAAGEATPAPAAPTPAPAAPTPQSRGRGGDSNTPRIELFGGYSYWRALSPYAVNRIAWSHGASASLAYNFNRYLGLVADIGGYNVTRFTPGPNGGVVAADGSVFSYLFGPRLSFRHDRFTPFVQVLLGTARASQVTLSNCTVSCTPLSADDTFAMTAGGGLDIRASRHFAIRLFQAEYLMTRFPDTSANSGDKVSQNNVRLSTGIVFRFGAGAEIRRYAWRTHQNRRSQPH